MDSSMTRPVLAMRWELATGPDGQERPVARWVTTCPAADRVAADHPVAEGLLGDRHAAAPAPTPTVVSAA